MSDEQSSWWPGIGTVISVVALGVSGASLWITVLKQPVISVFVPSVVQYAAPYNNTNFEVIGVPLTLVNDGARTGTVIGMTLTVTDPRTRETKRFYAADLGRWSMERTRAGAYTPFAPISLTGRTSRSETVLFYTRGESEKPPQMIREVGPYQFTLSVELAEAESGGGLAGASQPAPLRSERELRTYDARAFNQGTLPLYDRGFNPPPAPGPN